MKKDDGKRSKPFTKEQDQLRIRNIRKIDELGRIVIPLNIREDLNWKYSTKINIACTIDCITLMENNEGCCVIDRFGRIKIPKHILETSKISIGANIELIHSSNRVHLYKNRSGYNRQNDGRKGSWDLCGGG